MLRMAVISFALLATVTSSCGDEYLGRLSSNPYVGDGSANEFSLMNNPYYANSFENDFGPYGNHYSGYSPNNRFATEGPELYGTADGF